MTPPADSSPSCFQYFALQVSHRAAAVTLFLLVGSFALSYFHKDAGLLLPVALALAAVTMAAGAILWIVSRRREQPTAEPRGVAIFGFILLAVGIVLMILARAGKL